MLIPQGLERRNAVALPLGFDLSWGIGNRAVGFKTAPAGLAVRTRTLGQIDEVMARQDIFDQKRISVVGLDGNQGAAAANALGIDLRILLADAMVGERSNQATGSGADQG